MSAAKEPKEYDLKARKSFTLNGQSYKKGEEFKAYIVGAFVKDGVELAELKIGEHRPNAVPWEYVQFAELSA
jgi:hypothetical protein